MSIPQSGDGNRMPLRLWPGVAVVVVQWLAWLVVPLIVPGLTGLYISVGGGFLGGLAVLLWWLLLSRAPWPDRLGAVVVATVAWLGTARLLHESVSTLGMGMLFPIYAIPFLSLAFVVWAVASRRLAPGPRRASMVATIVLACGGWVLVRTPGVTGDNSAQFVWRWSQTAEAQLLAHADDTPSGQRSVPLTGGTQAEWPGFRGPDRDAVVPGVRIGTDWSESPPVELWRRPVGPGWSSLAVWGDSFYTQEQRGDDEVVACYKTSTGEPVWWHSDTVRFWEANSGPGPRGTPTLSDGRVYTFGATGIVNALEASDGTLVWSRNAGSDTDRKVPYWGFASSPLVMDDLVIIAAADRLIAYDKSSGEPRWRGPKTGMGYGSPHLVTIDGVPQVLLVHGTGLTSLAPADGILLWEHSSLADSRVLQPALIPNGDILIGSGFAEGIGVSRIAVARGPSGWTVEERWTSRGLKPYFNDFVVHEGHAYGFDGRILSCIDLQDGRRQWKGGRYGHGQMLLLRDQGLLLVLSEEGELALVRATPDQFEELARFQAIEGKTWNHPVLVGNRLFVRNGQEMAAFSIEMAN